MNVKDAQKAFNNATKEVTKAKLLLITIERGYEEFVERHTQALEALAQAESLLHDAAREVVEASVADSLGKEEARAKARADTIASLAPKVATE